MENVKELIADLGQKNVERALGVSAHAIKLARQNNIMPAMWYGVVSRMCANNGIACPLALFTFKGEMPPPLKHVTDPKRIQGAGRKQSVSGAAR